MSRIVDRGAIVAAYVGIGMAAVIAVSFLLVIPIPVVFALLALPAGLIIGYYADSRAQSSGESRAGSSARTPPSTSERPPQARLSWSRILANGAFAGVVTALSLAVMFLAVDALFFFADDGYRDKSAGPALQCQPGPGCVYARYLANSQGPDLEREGVTDVDTFTAFYWEQQLTTAGIVFGLAVAGSLGGALLYGVVRPKPARPVGRASEV